MNLSDLTLDQARKIEAGVLCDALIAEATGKVAFISSEDVDIAALIGLLESGGKVIVMRDGKPLKVGAYCGKDVLHIGKLPITPWQPSTDANAAIEAAETWGIFRCESPELCVLYKTDEDASADPWGVGKALIDGDEYGIVEKNEPAVACAPTFPLALCRAILVREVEKRQ